jgi:hypothetical protein
MTAVFGIATAALYGLACAAALFTVRRWVVPLSGLAVAVLSLLPLAFVGDSLLRGRAHAPIDLPYHAPPLAAHRAAAGFPERTNGVLSDVSCQNVPFRAAVRRSFGSGEWPLWNPYINAGEVLLGSAQAAPFFLPNLLAMPLPLPNGLTLSAALHYFLAALSAFLLARELGLREGAALFSAATWTYSNFLVFWSGWPIGSAVGLVPAVLFAIRRAIARAEPRWLLLLAVVFSQMVHAGHPESALHVLVLAGGLAAVELWRLAARARFAALRRLFVAGVVCCGLTAIYALPVIDALTQASEWEHRRAGGRAFRAADPDYARAALLADVLPFVFGFDPVALAPDRPTFWGPGASIYAGSVAWPLALLGVGASLRRGSRWWMAAVLLLAFGVLAGAKAPVVYPLLYRLPVLSWTLNDRLVFVAVLMLALLVGKGVDTLESSRVAAWLAALSALVLALLAGLFAAVWPAVSSGLPAPFLKQHFGYQALPLALLLLAALAWLAREPRGMDAGGSGGRWRVSLLAIALLLLVGQRRLEMGWFYPSLPARAFYPRVPPLDGLPANGPPYRMAAQDFVLVPNASAVYGLSDVRGYNAIHHARQERTWPLWCEREGFWFLRVRDLSRPFLSFLNVRYGLQYEAAGEPAGWETVAVASGTRLVRNPDALARAFVPPRLRVAEGTAADLAWLLSRTNFRRTVLLEPLRPRADLRPGVIDNGRGRVLDISKSGSRYRLEVEMESPAWVVLSETHWRGWRARAGGRELPLAFAHHAFLGFEVPAGRHRVEVLFRPRSFDVGLALLVATLGAGAVWAVWSSSRSRANERGGRASLHAPSRPG